MIHMADKPDGHRTLSDEEKEIALEGPAISANRCLLSLGSAGVRITFIEQVGDRLPKFRTAVMMPVQDAISLKTVLTRLLAEIEEDLEKQIAAAKDAAKQDG